MELTPTVLRALADASYATMSSEGIPDPLHAVLPGTGLEPATSEQVAAVAAALAPRSLRQCRTASGDPMPRNVALLRSELRRDAARRDPRAAGCA